VAITVAPPDMPRATPRSNWPTNLAATQHTPPRRARRRAPATAPLASSRSSWRRGLTGSPKLGQAHIDQMFRGTQETASCVARMIPANKPNPDLPTRTHHQRAYEQNHNRRNGPSAPGHTQRRGANGQRPTATTRAWPQPLDPRRR
jgi:hypothetical protein